MNFSLTYKQKMCIGNGSSDSKQLGAFQAQVSDSAGNIIAGVRIRKSASGKSASVDYYVNGKIVKTGSVDLSYNNKSFGSKEEIVSRTSSVKSTS